MKGLEMALNRYYAEFKENYPLGISETRSEDELIADIELCIDTGHKAEDFPFDEFTETVHIPIKKRLLEEGTPVKEGVREILEYLKENGYIIGMASSSSKESVMGHLKETGLEKYFRAVITGDMVEHSKPDPDIYLKACEELGVTPTNVVAIEDSHNGVRSAYRAGMKPVMVPDLIEPTPEIEAMLYGKFYSLLDVLDYMKNNNKNEG